jgi:hypothetical protein
MTDTPMTMSELQHFTGTERWFRHSLAPGVTYTEGAQYVAERAGAYWLLDKIAISNKFDDKLKGEEFQVWKLQRDAEGNGANLIVEDGNDNIVHTERIEYTDFPLPEFTFWFVDDVIMLPREY